MVNIIDMIFYYLAAEFYCCFAYFRNESEFIEAVVAEISCKLSGSTSTFINFKKLLAGVNSCLEKLQIQAAKTIKVQWRQPTIATPLIFYFFYFS